MESFSLFLTEFSRSHADYLSAWMVYIGCMILAFVVFWRMTQGIKWSWLQQGLRLLLALILLMPTQVMESSNWMTPAVMALAMHVLSGHTVEVVHILDQYIWGAALAGLILVLMQAWRLKQKLQQKAVAAQAK